MIRYSLGKLLCSRHKIFPGITSLGGQIRRTSTLRRSFLCLLGNQMNNLENAAQLSVDCVALDCENKEKIWDMDKVRQNIKGFLDNLDVNSCRSEWCVKINPVQTHELCDADLAAVLSANNLPASICLPKICNPDQLHWFAERVWNHLIKRPENNRGPLKLLMKIESAKALLNLPELCKKAEELATMAPIFPVGLVLGGSELSTDLGASKTSSGLELLYVKEKFILIAKAFGLQAIDMSFDKKDKNLFKEKCEEGVALGFTGKEVVNPAEAVIAQDMFVPSRSKIVWAKTVLRKFYNSQDKGELNFENSEVDNATFRRAEHILNVAIAVGKTNEKIENFKQEG